MIMLSCVSLYLGADNQGYRQSANACLHFEKHCAKKLTYARSAGPSESPLGPLELELRGIGEFPLVSEA